MIHQEFVHDIYDKVELSMLRIFLRWLKLSSGWLELELECIIEEREVYDCGAWSVFGVPGDEWYSYQHHFLY